MTGAGGFLSALAAVQAEMPAMPKDKTNPHFGSKFTGLDTIVSIAGPLLNKHGLVWIAKPSHDESGPTLDYRLVHVETGEGEQGTMPLLLTKMDSQGLGSALTYARRYALCAVLNLVSDDDDDGNTASSAPAARATSQPGRTAQGVTASPAQLKFVKSLVTKSKASRGQLHAILERSGFDGVVIEEGWLEKLTGGKQGSASALIDWLQSRPLPDLEHPSDVDSDTSDFEPADPAEAARLAEETFGVGTA